VSLTASNQLHRLRERNLTRLVSEGVLEAWVEILAEAAHVNLTLRNKRRERREGGGGRRREKGKNKKKCNKRREQDEKQEEEDEGKVKNKNETSAVTKPE
jgi:hypothetical protein